MRMNKALDPTKITAVVIQSSLSFQTYNDVLVMVQSMTHEGGTPSQTELG